MAEPSPKFVCLSLRCGRRGDSRVLVHLMHQPLIAVIKLLTEVTQGRKGLYTHTVEGKALHLGCEAADRVASAVRKESRMKAGIQLAFSILFGLRPQSRGWCHPCSAKPHYNRLRRHTQMPVPMVILNPLPLTRTTAYVFLNINLSASRVGNTA